MVEVPVGAGPQSDQLDICTSCQFVWFDHSEFEALPVESGSKRTEVEISPEGWQSLGGLELDVIQREQDEAESNWIGPDGLWKWCSSYFGLPVEYDPGFLQRWPLLTWFIIFVVSTASLAAFQQFELTTQDFGFIPAAWSRYGGLSFLTAFFIHGGVTHLLVNMYFLLVFGDNVEDWLGRWKFVLLLILAAAGGALAHLLGNPSSTIPLVGASGGISGVIAFYVFRFPHARLGQFVHIFIIIRWLRMPAYMWFCYWILLQITGVWFQLKGFSHVSVLSHVGGAAVGVLFWWVTRRQDISTKH